MNTLGARYSRWSGGTHRNTRLRDFSVILVLLILSYFDFASVLAVAVLGLALSWSVRRLWPHGKAILQLWIAGFLVRIGVAIVQTGNQLVLVSNDANLYESNGRLFASLPIDEWSSKLGGYTSSVRGIVLLHGLTGKLNPVFRLGVYVALLSVAGSAVAVAMALRLILPRISQRKRMPLTIFLSLSPAFVFWGSQNTKEGFVCFGLTLFVYGALQSKSRTQIVVGMLICWAFRPYVAAIALVAAVAALGYAKFLARREQARPLLLASCFAVLLSLGILNGSSIAGRDITAYAGGVTRSGGGSLDPGFLGLSPSSPIIQGVRMFFTPPPWFIPKTPFELFSVLEGFVVAIVLIATMRRMFGPRGSRDFATLATFLATFLICAVYGIGSNIGTNVRIRTTAYPLVFVLFVYSQKFGASDEPADVDARHRSPRARLPEPYLADMPAHSVSLQRPRT